MLPATRWLIFFPPKRVPKAQLHTFFWGRALRAMEVVPSICDATLHNVGAHLGSTPPAALVFRGDQVSVACDLATFEDGRTVVVTGGPLGSDAPSAEATVQDHRRSPSPLSGLTKADIGLLMLSATPLIPFTWRRHEGPVALRGARPPIEMRVPQLPWHLVTTHQRSATYGVSETRSGAPPVPDSTDDADGDDLHGDDGTRTRTAQNETRHAPPNAPHTQRDASSRPNAGLVCVVSPRLTSPSARQRITTDEDLDAAAGRRDAIHKAASVDRQRHWLMVGRGVRFARLAMAAVKQQRSVRVLARLLRRFVTVWVTRIRQRRGQHLLFSSADEEAVPSPNADASAPHAALMSSSLSMARSVAFTPRGCDMERSMAFDYRPKGGVQVPSYLQHRATSDAMSKPLVLPASVAATAEDAPGSSADGSLRGGGVGASLADACLQLRRDHVAANCRLTEAELRTCPAFLPLFLSVNDLGTAARLAARLASLFQVAVVRPGQDAASYCQCTGAPPPLMYVRHGAVGPEIAVDGFITAESVTSTRKAEEGGFHFTEGGGESFKATADTPLTDAIDECRRGLPTPADRSAATPASLSVPLRRHPSLAPWLLVQAARWIPPAIPVDKPTPTSRRGSLRDDGRHTPVNLSRASSMRQVTSPLGGQRRGSVRLEGTGVIRRAVSMTASGLRRDVAASSSGGTAAALRVANTAAAIAALKLLVTEPDMARCVDDASKPCSPPGASGSTSSVTHNSGKYLRTVLCVMSQSLRAASHDGAHDAVDRQSIAFPQLAITFRDGQVDQEEGVVDGKRSSAHRSAAALQQAILRLAPVIGASSVSAQLQSLSGAAALAAGPIPTSWVGYRAAVPDVVTSLSVPRPPAATAQLSPTSRYHGGWGDGGDGCLPRPVRYVCLSPTADVFLADPLDVRRVLLEEFPALVMSTPVPVCWLPVTSTEAAAAYALQLAATFGAKDTITMLASLGAAARPPGRLVAANTGLSASLADSWLSPLAAVSRYVLPPSDPTPQPPSSSSSPRQAISRDDMAEQWLNALRRHHGPTTASSRPRRDFFSFKVGSGDRPQAVPPSQSNPLVLAAIHRLLKAVIHTSGAAKNASATASTTTTTGDDSRATPTCAITFEGAGTHLVGARGAIAVRGERLSFIDIVLYGCVAVTTAPRLGCDLPLESQDGGFSAHRPENFVKPPSITEPSTTALVHVDPTSGPLVLLPQLIPPPNTPRTPRPSTATTRCLKRGAQRRSPDDEDDSDAERQTHAADISDEQSLAQLQRDVTLRVAEAFEGLLVDGVRFDHPTLRVTAATPTLVLRLPVRLLASHAQAALCERRRWEQSNAAAAADPAAVLRRMQSEQAERRVAGPSQTAGGVGGHRHWAATNAAARTSGAPEGKWMPRHQRDFMTHSEEKAFFARRAALAAFLSASRFHQATRHQVESPVMATNDASSRTPRKPRPPPTQPPRNDGAVSGGGRHTQRTPSAAGAREAGEVAIANWDGFVSRVFACARPVEVRTVGEKAVIRAPVGDNGIADHHHVTLSTREQAFARERRRKAEEEAVALSGVTPEDRWRREAADQAISGAFSVLLKRVKKVASLSE